MEEEETRCSICNRKIKPDEVSGTLMGVNDAGELVIAEICMPCLKKSPKFP